VKVDFSFENYQILYLFENLELIISEIKDRSVDESMPPHKRFFWFLYDKNENHLIKLDFVSMLKRDSHDSSEYLEERVFEQGHFKFNKNEGVFKFKIKSNQKNFVLKSTSNIQNNFKMSILEYFRKS
jgi:hypothetical protein